MNRLPAFYGTKPGDGIAEHVAQTGQLFGRDLYSSRRVRVFCPVHYEANYAYPLLVWLHSSGTDERQLLRVMPWISLRNFAAVAPCAPWFDQHGDGYRWIASPSKLDVVYQLVEQAIEEAQQRLHIHPRRVFIAGYQEGGTMALRLALHRPEQFAAAASINGPFPRDGAPLHRLGSVRRLPLWIAQGEHATAYPRKQFDEDLKLFYTAAMTVMLRQYSCGDEIHVRMLSDLNSWLMERVVS